MLTHTTQRLNRNPAVAYISPLIASLIAETGATCDLAAADDAYARCKQQVQRELITSVGLASAASTLLMGLWANLPFLLAPGIGTSAYFVYSVVGVRGGGPVAYRTATTAVVLEGLIFLLLSATGVRAWLVKGLPEELKLGMSGGIGLFLAFIGLQEPEGIGLVAGSRETLVTLGGCPPTHRRYLQLGGGSPTAAGPAFECAGGKMASPTAWLGVAALLLMAALLDRGVRTAVGGVILAVGCLSWIPGTPFSYFGSDAEGRERFAFFRRVVSVEGMAHVAGQVEFTRLFSDGHVWVALLTILYTDILDTTGSLYSMARQARMVRPDGSFEGERAAFCVDALGACIAGLLGFSPCVVFIGKYARLSLFFLRVDVGQAGLPYVSPEPKPFIVPLHCLVHTESSIAIEIGARTGLAAVASACGFLLSIVFNPILSSIPPYATGAALVLVGCILMEHLANIDWTKRRSALPAFLTAILMPFTYSIAFGVLSGIGCEVALRVLVVALDRLGVGFGRCRGRGGSRKKPEQQSEAESLADLADA